MSVINASEWTASGARCSFVLSERATAHHLWRRCHRAAASTGSGQELEYEKCANCDGGGHGGSSVSRCGKVECRRVAEVQQQ